MATSPRPLDKQRLRRLSAPSSLTERPSSKQWVTLKQTSWRTNPSLMGYRIDIVPAGWQVSEAEWSQDPIEGWLPIKPRGYLQIGDVVEVAEEDMHSFLSPGSAGSPPVLSPQAEKSGSAPEQSVASARIALLALREEHVRLREANIKLRERELSKKRELDSLEQNKQLREQRLAQVQEELEEGGEELKTLRGKLELCREAITTAVKSVDALYQGMEQGSHVSEVVHLASNATLAGETVGELLAATQDAYSKGRENAVRKEKAVEKTAEKERQDRAPLRALNVP